MEAQKVVLDVVRQAGSPDKVVISFELIGAHTSVRQSYHARFAKEKLEKEVEERQKKKHFD